MAIVDMGGNTEFAGTSPGQAQAYPPGFFIGSSATITALAAGTQATSPAIMTQQVLVNSAAAAAGVVLPKAVAGVEVVINNAGTGANTITVFGQGSDTINGTAGPTGVIQAITTVTIYYCFASGAWLTK